MNYEMLSDNEIINLINQKDDDAMEFLIKKYNYVVKREVRTVYLIGAETEDLIQEGTIGLFKAIRDYNDDKGASFSTFATLCVKNQIKTAISASNRQKHIPLNSYISLYTSVDDNGTPLAEGLEDINTFANPESAVIARENVDILMDKIKKTLSEYENKVLEKFLDGKSYMQIGEELGRTEKSIDNALHRIRTKLSTEDKNI